MSIHFVSGGNDPDAQKIETCILSLDRTADVTIVRAEKGWRVEAATLPRRRDARAVIRGAMRLSGVSVLDR